MMPNSPWQVAATRKMYLDLRNAIFNLAVLFLFLKNECRSCPLAEQLLSVSAHQAWRSPALDSGFCRRMGTFRALCYNGREIAEIFS